MFTIEHGFDATSIILVDDEAAPTQEDIAIHVFDDCVVLEQGDTQTERVHRIQLSMNQVKDLQAALNLPEGAYKLARPKP